MKPTAWYLKLNTWSILWIKNRNITIRNKGEGEKLFSREVKIDFHFKKENIKLTNTRTNKHVVAIIKLDVGHVIKMTATEWDKADEYRWQKDVVFSSNDTEIIDKNKLQLHKFSMWWEQFFIFLNEMAIFDELRQFIFLQ